MGSSIEGTSFHEVTLATFQIMAFEVTVSQYDECVASSACPAAGVRIESDDFTFHCNEGVAGRGNHPINCVTWYGADAYCRWIGRRLLTEEEWQYAVTRGGTRIFPWGNAVPDASRLNLFGDESWGTATSWGEDGYVGTAPVGRFPLGATEDGIFDLGGNVWELLSSRFCPYPSTPCTSCPQGAVCDNSCDSGCTTLARVHRGGSYAEDAAWGSQVGASWLNWRGGSAPDFPTPYVGFRCGRSIP
jgi:formylglycine-generating enzyme required for sulfatase activity